MKNILLSAIAIFPVIFSAVPSHASCDFAWENDSHGYRCGGRAASERAGGRNPISTVREQGDSYYYQPSRPYPVRLSPGQAVNAFVHLTAEDPQAQINLRRYGSINAPIVGHGRVGDRVWVSGVRTDDYGSYWYKVGYEGTAIVGWVREDLITR